VTVPQARPLSEPPPAGAVGEEHVFLVGRPPMDEYLAFMSTEPVDSQGVDLGSIANEWRSSNDRVRELQLSEATWADNPPVKQVPKELDELAMAVLTDPFFKKSFSIVPADIGMVELDRLVVFQKIINLEYVRQLKARLGNSPSQEDVFRTCLPVDHPTLPPMIRRIAYNGFVFMSESNDLRFHEPVLLRPDQIPGYQATGPVAGIVGLVVGYGSNYLNVISAEGRLILSNGSHRAYALRDLGVTHVPCVIQRVSRRDELKVIGTQPLQQATDLYLKEPRPPVLKDYFDQKMRKIISLPPKARQVRISFGVEQNDMPWA